MSLARKDKLAVIAELEGRLAVLTDKHQALALRHSETLVQMQGLSASNQLLRDWYTEHNENIPMRDS